MRVSIVGATGYSGLELIRLLNSHAKVTIQSLHSYSNYSENIACLYPHLKGVCELPLEAVDVERICQVSQAVFFATPSGVAKDQVADFLAAGLIVIDLSGDLRLKQQQQYQKWYGFVGANQELLDVADYGLAEWCKGKQSKLVANPGCYATATLLALAPLLQQDCLELDSLIVDAKSGVSGAGKNPTSSNLYAEVNDNLQLYKVNQHQHIPEIMQQLQQWQPAIESIQFTTSLLPITRGILVTIYGTLKKSLTGEVLTTFFQQAYADKRFVRIHAAGQLPTIKQVVGSNYCDIGFVVDETTKRITIVATIDNLIKGAAGQAIQNLNRLADFPVDEGLQFSPIYP